MNQQKIKGDKRFIIISLYSRAYVLDNLVAVDFVVPFNNEWIAYYRRTGWIGSN